MPDVSMLPRTRAVLEQGIADGLHLGVQLYVSLAGEVVVDAGVGESQPGTEMTSRTINPWLSAGKPLTAFALARLKNRGILAYDDPLGRLLPEWRRAGQPEVTLLHLLTHQAGFRNRDVGWPAVDWDQLLARIIESPDSVEAADSSAGYVVETSWFVLGEIVAREAGTPFARAFRELVTEPLGLESTFNGLTPEEYDNLAGRLGRMYETPRDAAPRDLGWHQPDFLCPASPGANSRGPIAELGKFYEMMLAEGILSGRRVLASEEIRLLTARHRAGRFDRTFQHEIDWGLGFIVNSRRYSPRTVPYGFGRFASDRAFGHGGAQSSIGFADPACELVVAWVANGRPGEPRHQRRNRAINEAIYQDLGLNRPLASSVT
jgi:CubicO group peptidase (beta-lactamase class C family)